MSRLLIGVHRPGEGQAVRRPAWRIDDLLEREEYHDDVVDIWAEAPLGAPAAHLIACRNGWLVALSGWVSLCAEPARALTARDVSVRLGASGPRVLETLSGEFVVFVQHVASRRWWLVRDCAGVQRSVYAQSPRVLAMGTEVREVAAAAGLHVVPDMGHLAALMATGPPTDSSTPLGGVRCLPGGHRLTGVAGDGQSPTLTRWWSPPSRTSPPLDSVTTLRSAVRHALQGRIAASGPNTRVAVELSGGLDSTLLASVVSECLPKDRVVALTLVEAGAGATDPPFARRAAKALGLELVEVPWVPRTAVQILAECDGGGRLPDPANGFGLMFDVARDLGAGLLVSGAGGDQLTSSWPGIAMWDFLKARDGAGLQAMRFLRKPHAWREATRMLASDLAVWIVRDGALRRALRARRMKRTTPWIAPHVLARHDVVRRTDRSRTRGWGDWRSDVLIDPWDQWARDTGGHHAARAGIAVTTPFWTRGVLEAALAIPEVDRWDRGDGRALARRLLPLTVPAAVRSRSGKADFTSAVLQESMWNGLGGPDHWLTVRHEVVRAEAVADLLGALSVGEADCWQGWRLAAPEWALRAAASIHEEAGCDALVLGTK